MRIPGVTRDGELGFRFGSPLDTDGDRIADFAAGARFTSVPERPTSQMGVVYAWSGRDREPRMSWVGQQNDGMFGHTVTLLPDISGDGLADIVAAGPTYKLPSGSTRGSLWARSVQSGTDLWSRSSDVPGDAFGWDLALTHDHDSDGVGDLFVGAPGGPVGAAYLLSGRDGAVLARYQSRYGKDSFGWYLSTVSDLDGDGRDDLAVGAPTWRRGRDELVGAAFVVSSATGDTLLEWTGAGSGAQFGEIVCGLPDLNGDGKPEIAVSATYTQAVAGVLAGQVSIYSGADGRVIRYFKGRQARELYGRMVARAGDFDGDGLEDVAIGAPWYQAGDKQRAGRLEIRSGRDGGLLAELVGDSAQRWLGWHMAPAHNVGKERESGLLISLVRSEENGLVGAGALEMYVYRPNR